VILVASFLTPTKENRKISLKETTAIIGRDGNADIWLNHSSVSREHAQVKLIEGKSHFIIEDRGSANGTYVDGVKVNERSTLYPDQKLEVGPFRFSLCLMPGDNGPNGQGNGKDVNEIVREEYIVQEAVRTLPDMMPSAKRSEDGGDKAFAEEAEKALYKRIIELLPAHTKVNRAERLTKMALTLSLGLGPLEEWLSDPDISEIMINGTESIYIEKNGVMSNLPSPFKDEFSIMRIVDRILSPLGRRVDEKSPYVDGRLPDGSRINVIIPPVSLTGSVLTIRKFSEERLDIARLVGMKTISEEAANFLEKAVIRKRNILISGGTGTGKTTLLNSLASFIPSWERVITIEDAAELNLEQEHVVRLETRPPNIEGESEITTRDLVKNSLRMRPDRIIVGECRGGEALDMLQAMNTGHEGSMTTCHANSPRDALKRLEMMALMTGIDLPLRVIREQIASGINIIIQVSRLAEGRRAVTSILEVDGIEMEQILTQPIFEHRNQSSSLENTGIQASFLVDAETKQVAQQPNTGVK
jgi:pilus assembly protein CpaF